MARVPVHAHSGLNDGGLIAGSTVTLLTGAASGGSSSGTTGAIPLSVTDGTNTVASVTTVDFRGGSTVSDGGGGQANVLPSAAARVLAYLSYR